MEIINKMILSSILELLLWSAGKVITCFCNIKMLKKYGFHVKSHEKQVSPLSDSDQIQRKYELINLLSG